MRAYALSTEVTMKAKGRRGFSRSSIMDSVATNKGNSMLVHESYLYKFNRKRGLTSYWRCDVKSCSAKVIKKGEHVMTSKPHDHPPDREAIVRRQFMEAVTQAVKKNPTANIVTIYRYVSSFLVFSPSLTLTH